MHSACIKHAQHPYNAALEIRRYCAKLGGTKKSIFKLEVNTERAETGDGEIVPVI